MNKFYNDKILYLGKSAELSGLSMWDFVEFLEENKVAAIDYSEKTIGREFDDAEEMNVVCDSSVFM